MLLAPVLGPVIGGFLSQAADWRWIFWLLTILVCSQVFHDSLWFSNQFYYPQSGITAIVGFVFLRETYGPTLLERKAAKLRKASGNPHIQSASKSPLPFQQLVLLAIMRPMKLLCTSPVSIVMALYMGLIFGIIYLLFTSYTVVFQEKYGFSQGIAGLTYLGMGLGCATQLLMGVYSDKIHTKLTERHGVERAE